MRNKLLLLSFFISLSSFAQLKPKAMISYAPSEEYSDGDAIVRMPNISVKSGLAYTWKFLTADFDNTFWVSKADGLMFAPIQARFDIGLEARMGQVRIRICHSCLHPVASDAVMPVGLYGACTKISLSYGY